MSRACPRKRLGLASFVAGAAIALCTSLEGQAPPTTPVVAPPAAAQPRSPLRVGPVTVTGSLRSRAEGWDWFTTPGYDYSYAFGASLVRVAVTYSRPRVDVQVEVAQPTLLGLPDNAIAPAPQGQLGLGASYRAASGAQDASIFLKQAFIRFKGLGSPANMIRVGRVEFWDGSETVPADASLGWLKRERVAHRLIGNFGFSHVQRSFDAVQASRDTPRLNLTLFAGFPTQGVFQLDGQGSIRDVAVQYAAATVPGRTAEARLFAVHYRDGRGLVPTDNRAVAVRSEDRKAIDVYSLGGHVLSTFPLSFGTADLLLWGALQAGSWGAQDHHAHSFAAEIGVQPALPLRPWVRAGYQRGSGDDDPESSPGGKHRTFFQILPTPRIYARTPFYNLMNTEDRFVQLILRPGTATTVRSDLHQVRLAEPRDLWYSGGGAFDEKGFGFAGRPSGGERDLATVLDLGIDRQFGSLTTASLYVSRVFGGEVTSGLHPDGNTGHYLYLELTRRF